MPLSHAGKIGIANLLFENTAFELVGDAGGLLGSSTPGSLYFGLHTAQPAYDGDQTSNEVTGWGNYARQAVARADAQWSDISSGDLRGVSNVNPISYLSNNSGGTIAVTHCSIGTAVSGAGVLIGWGALSQTVQVQVNATADFAAGALKVYF